MKLDPDTIDQLADRLIHLLATTPSAGRTEREYRRELMTRFLDTSPELMPTAHHDQLLESARKANLARITQLRAQRDRLAAKLAAKLAEQETNE